MLSNLFHGIYIKAKYTSFPIHGGGYAILGVSIPMAICFALFGIEDINFSLITELSILILLGFVMVVLFKAPEKPLPYNGILTISFIILLCCLVGTIPYVSWGMDFPDAFFESVSGFTTTGITSITDLSTIPTSILMWRSITGWLGGLGFIILFTLMMTTFGLKGRFLFGSDILSDYRIFTNRLKGVCVQFFFIYALVTFIEASLLILFGNSPIDSICLAMGTVSTTGFAVANNELVSLSIESRAIIMIFMVIAATNFITAYTSIVKRSLKPYSEDSELKIMLIWFLFAIIILIILLIQSGFSFSSEESLFDTVFYCLSVATTTGFVSEYVSWANTAVIFLSIVALVGGCSNSSAGGLKILRFDQILKMTTATIKNAVSPNTTYSVGYKGKDLNSNVVYSGIVMMVLFLIVAAVGAGAITIMDPALTYSNSITLSIASLTNVGTGLFALTPMELGIGIQLVMCLLMWIGKLEIILAVIIFTPGFWRTVIKSRFRKT